MKSPHETPETPETRETQGNHPGDFEHDPLWDLLGKADQVHQPVAVSPFFARNVVREVRLSRDPRGGSLPALFSLLRRLRLSVAGLAAAAVVTLFYGSVVLDNPASTQNPTGSPLAQSLGDSRDVEVIKHLDELLDLDDSSVWLESPASTY